MRFLFCYGMKRRNSSWLLNQPFSLLEMTGTRKKFTLEEVKKAFEKFKINPTRVDFAICLKDDEQMIGDLAIVDIDKDNYSAAFRIALHHPDFKNKGLGTEGVQLLMQYAFEELKLNRLQLEVFSHNKAAIKSYLKAGFKLEGTLKQALYYHGVYSDMLILAILFEEYKHLYK
ncbi:GNAT family N-acetyltransferase [Alkalihalobacillus sp. 1P02AB]|uniref:GNAT family N-acetyltransferase n=1 Tax=Alkalihalobacillus sp. 1P02AB TaxID=3132260 RepID=UPI0039A765F9